MRRFTLFISLVAAAWLFSGCSEELLSPDGIEFTLSESGNVTTNAEEVSLNDFSSKLIGHGWAPMTIKLILDDGSLGSLPTMTGGGYFACFIDKYDLTWFCIFPLSKTKASYPYTFENSSINYGPFPAIRVLSVSKNQFSCIQNYGILNRKEMWCYVVYKRMSDAELEEHWKSTRE